MNMTPPHPPSSTTLQALHTHLLEQYISRNPNSAALHKQARQLLPGGTTRSVLSYSPFPLTFTAGHNCTLTSLDKHEYLDMVSEYSAAFFGHSHPSILQAISSTLKSGLNFGGCGTREVELAGKILSRFDHMDKIRFCNSGTEANLLALSLAMTLTGRRKVLIFEGAYHGGVMGFNKTPSTAQANMPYEWVLAKYNDVESVKSLVGDEIAAILVEPMLGAGGMVPASVEFLRALRGKATEVEAVLIFDEVVTSRLHFAGLQGKHDIYPDITTLGKYLGGGLSFGAVCGTDQIMHLLDPAITKNAIHHSGTYNNNVLSMAAGLAAAELVTPESIERTNKLGDSLRSGIQEMLDEGNKVGMRLTGLGSLLGIHFEREGMYTVFFLFMLLKGIYVGSRGFVALNMAHDEYHVDQVLDAVGVFLETIEELDDETIEKNQVEL